MKPIDQDTPRNCYAASIASILEVPIDALREFDRLYWAYWKEARHGRHDFSKRQAFERELLRLGVRAIHLPARGGPAWIGVKPKGYSIASGPGPRGVDHSCVALDGEIVHDPHESRAGLLEIADYEVLIPVLPVESLPPSRPMREGPAAER